MWRFPVNPMLWKSINYGLPSNEGLTQKHYLKDTRSKDLQLLDTPIQVKGPKEWFYRKASKLWNSAPVQLRTEQAPSRAKRIIKEFAKSLAFVE